MRKRLAAEPSPALARESEKAEPNPRWRAPSKASSVPMCRNGESPPRLTRRGLLYGVESRKGARPGTSVSRWFPFPAHQTGRAQLEHPAFRLVSPQRPRNRSENTAPGDGTPDNSFALRQQLDGEHAEPQRLSDLRQ